MRSAPDLLAAFSSYLHCWGSDRACPARQDRPLLEARDPRLPPSGLASYHPTEALNLGIQTVRRYGLRSRNFDNFRFLFLLALCTNQEPSTLERAEPLAAEAVLRTSQSQRQRAPKQYPTSPSDVLLRFCGDCRYDSELDQTRLTQAASLPIFDHSGKLAN